MAEPLCTLETPDGRVLAFAVWGDPDGFPILTLHGSPAVASSDGHTRSSTPISASAW
jgi:hypothetical protein